MVRMKKLPACPLRRAKTEKADSDKKDSTEDANITGPIAGESNIQPVVGPAEQPSQPKGESNITGGNVTIVTTPNSPSAKEENPQGRRKKRAGVRLVRVDVFAPNSDHQREQQTGNEVPGEGHREGDYNLRKCVSSRPNSSIVYCNLSR